MLNKFEAIYCIPGWGFHSQIFQYSVLSQVSDLPLDYFYLVNPTLDSVTTHLATLIGQQSVLLAWSLGGLFAINLAYLFPGKIKKIILISSQPSLIANNDWQGIDKKNTNKFLATVSEDQVLLATYFLKLVNYPNKVALYKKQLNRCLIFSK